MAYPDSPSPACVELPASQRPGKPEEKKFMGPKKDFLTIQQAFFQFGPTWIKKQLFPVWQYRLSPSNFHG
jgi:hypothetical protein